MIATFTDFGCAGPYLGQVRAVLHHQAPEIPVVDLVADAPTCDPRSSAYLLAALVGGMPPGTVFLCVVDPGVGTARGTIVIEADGHFFVGPDNGLLDLVIRRARQVRAWDIVWRPERLSASFHGRDLFAPVASRLAQGLVPEQAGCRPCAPPARPDWPDDLSAVVYVDHYGNAMTGLRAATVDAGARIAVAGRTVAHATVFGDVAPGAILWYENSCGLVEIAVNGGRADQELGVAVGTPIGVVA